MENPLIKLPGKDSYSYEGFKFIRNESWDGFPLYVPTDYQGWPECHPLENPVARIADKDMFSYRGMVFSRNGKDVLDMPFEYRGWERFPSDTRIVEYDKILYVPDPMFTWGKEYDPTKDSLKRLKKELSITKGAIMNESLPARLDVEVFMDEERQYQTGWDEYGRDYIIGLMGRVGFQEAFPELKHVLYYDSDPMLRINALRAMEALGGKRVAEAISGKLRDPNEDIVTKMLAAGALFDLPYKGNVIPLTRTYYETDEMRPGSDIDELAILSGNWLPLKCIGALAVVPSFSSLEGLERAAKSRFCDNEYAGRSSLKYWIALNRKMLARLPDNYETGERKSLLNKLEIRYDLGEPVRMSKDKPWLCDRRERNPYVINLHKTDWEIKQAKVQKRKKVPKVKNAEIRLGF